MADVLVEKTNLQNIANAIREKNGTDNSYKPSEMSQAILDIVGCNINNFPYEVEMTEYVHSENWHDNTLGLASIFCDTYCVNDNATDLAVYCCEVKNNTTQYRFLQNLVCMRYGTSVLGGITERWNNSGTALETINNINESVAIRIDAGAIITVNKIVLRGTE